MITYKQLLSGSGKTRKTLWYIRGGDEAIVADAAEIAKDHVYSDVSSVCLGVFFSDSDKDDLVSFILRPYYEERKLVIVHGASKFSNLSKYIDLSDKSTFYLLIDHDNAEPDQELHDLLTNNSKSRAVDCTVRAEEDLKLLVTSRLNISEDAVRLLVGKSRGDSEWLLNKVAILERFDVAEISQKLVSLVCTDEGMPKFENSLIQFDKQPCFLYIKGMGTADIQVWKIIEAAQRVSLLNTVSAEHGKQIRPISDRTGLTKKQIDEHIKYVAYYDSSSSKRCLNLLMRLYDRLTRGDRLAYIALVSGW
jgi:hypothetical protein